MRAPKERSCDGSSSQALSSIDPGESALLSQDKPWRLNVPLESHCSRSKSHARMRPSLAASASIAAET